MKWTPHQREQLMLGYALEGVAYCPDDLEPLVLDPESKPDTNGHGVNLRCPICARRSYSPTIPLGVALGWTLMR